MNELEDISTPSPPRSTSPVNKQSKVNPKQSSSGTANRKGGLLTLPMPPMVPGSEELSGDDDYISSPSSASHASTFKQNNTGFVTIFIRLHFYGQSNGKTSFSKEILYSFFHVDL